MRRCLRPLIFEVKAVEILLLDRHVLCYGAADGGENRMVKSAKEVSAASQQTNRSTAKGHWGKAKHTANAKTLAGSALTQSPMTHFKVKDSFNVGGFSVGMATRTGQQVSFDIDPLASNSSLSGRAAKELAEGRLTRDDIRMVIPDRTLERRIRDDQTLTLDEADGIVRLLRIVEAARRVFESNDLADQFLRSPNPALGGHVPIQLARSDLGGREVEAVLGRLEHGVFG